MSVLSQVGAIQAWGEANFNRPEYGHAGQLSVMAVINSLDLDIRECIHQLSRVFSKHKVSINL